MMRGRGLAVRRLVEAAPKPYGFAFRDRIHVLKQVDGFKFKVVEL
jgi:hypothetical protein